MAERRAFLDRSPGETRGVLTLAGAPERLLISRDGDATPRLSAVYLGRVRDVSARLGLARVDLGGGELGSLRLRRASPPPHQGRAICVTVVAEPAGGKPATLTVAVGGAVGEPRLLIPPPTVAARLNALAPDLIVEEGEVAREQADLAEASVLNRRHRTPGGVVLTIDPTAALVAVDVDLEPAATLSVGQANLLAIAEAARLLRLKALAGLVVIDLIGFPKDHRRLSAAAGDAFAPDGPETVLGGVGRFGTLELSKPHREQPMAERLLDPDGRPSARAVAQTLVRALERQGRFSPGQRWTARCAPEVAALLRPLAEQLGPRYAVVEAPGVARDHTDIFGL